MIKKCKHCGREITSESGTYWSHNEGGHRFKSRCDPDDSGLMYGYNADPIGEPCVSICLGYSE